MKKFAYIAIVALAASMVACGGNKTTEENANEAVEEVTEVAEAVVDTCGCDTCKCDTCQCDTVVVAAEAAVVE